jgi:hypothetical protein
MAASSFVSAKVTDSAGVGVGSGAGVGVGAGCGAGATTGLAQAPRIKNVAKNIINITEILLISLLFLKGTSPRNLHPSFLKLRDMDI